MKDVIAWAMAIIIASAILLAAVGYNSESAARRAHAQAAVIRAQSQARLDATSAYLPYVALTAVAGLGVCALAVAGLAPVSSPASGAGMVSGKASGCSLAFSAAVRGPGGSVPLGSAPADCRVTAAPAFSRPVSWSVGSIGGVFVFWAGIEEGEVGRITGARRASGRSRSRAVRPPPEQHEAEQRGERTADQDLPVHGRDAAAHLAGGDSPPQLASGIEFVLEGLHLSNRPNKVVREGAVRFERA